MGNCSACLSSHASCSGDHQQEDDADLLTRGASREPGADIRDLYKPLLKPCILHSQHSQLKGQMNHLTQGSGKCPRRVAPAPAAANHSNHNKTTGEINNVKAMKKVRFADERESEDLVLLQKKNQSSICINSNTKIPNDPTCAAVTQSGNIVQMKVLISKKDLSELLKTRDKQIPHDALIEKILTPVLISPYSSMHKLSQTFSAKLQHAGSLPWRPSLQLISEEH